MGQICSSSPPLHGNSHPQIFHWPTHHNWGWNRCPNVENVLWRLYFPTTKEKAAHNHIPTGPCISHTLLQSKLVSNNFRERMKERKNLLTSVVSCSCSLYNNCIIQLGVQPWRSRPVQNVFFHSAPLLLSNNPQVRHPSPVPGHQLRLSPCFCHSHWIPRSCPVHKAHAVFARCAAFEISGYELHKLCTGHRNT